MKNAYPNKLLPSSEMSDEYQTHLEAFHSIFTSNNPSRFHNSLTRKTHQVINSVIPRVNITAHSSQNPSPPHIRKTNVIFTYFQKYYLFFLITISISQIIIPLSKVQPHLPRCSNGGWKFHFGQSHWHRLHMKI